MPAAAALVQGRRRPDLHQPGSRPRPRRTRRRACRSCSRWWATRWAPASSEPRPARRQRDGRLQPPDRAGGEAPAGPQDARPGGPPRLAHLLRRRPQHDADDRQGARRRAAHEAGARAEGRARRRRAEAGAREGPAGDALLAPEGSNLDIPIAIIERSLAPESPPSSATALWVGYGGLVSYGPDYYAQGVQAAALVAKILRGASRRTCRSKAPTRSISR